MYKEVYNLGNKYFEVYSLLLKKQTWLLFNRNFTKMELLPVAWSSAAAWKFKGTRSVVDIFKTQWNVIFFVT